MAHKCLIDGTAYEVKGGRCLVDGTAYAIQKGRTLVDGTGYDVGFGGVAVAVTIKMNTTTANGQYCYATINGTKYSTAATGIEVFAGDVITFGCRGVVTNVAQVFGYIRIDGTAVAGSSPNGAAKTYDWVVPDGITAINISLAYIVNAFGQIGTVTVTTS